MNRILIILVVFSLSASALAQELKGGTVSSGGAAKMEGGGYTLYDIKGETAARQISDGTTTIQLGGIYILTEVSAEVIVAPPGTVPLNIAREEANLKISWNQNQYPNPQIFVLTGDGSGQFTNNTANWKPISDASFVNQFVADADFVLHHQQVGSGHPEAYYKALQSSVAADQIAATLPTALSVGKFNVLVAGAGNNPFRYSFVSVPFSISDDSPNAIFGAQVAAGNASAAATELWEWTGTTFGRQQFLHDQQGWQAIGNFGAVQVKPGHAYIFKTKAGSDDKIITIAGNVLTEFSRPVGANLYSFLANPYPNRPSLAAANLTPASGVFGGSGAGFSDQLWGWTGSTFGEQSFYDSTPAVNNWQKIGSFQEIASLSPGRGYVYRRHPAAPAGGFNWSFTP